MSADTTAQRVARCVYCGREAKSESRNVLAFFETAKHRAAGLCGLCPYADVAHESPIRERPHLQKAMSDGHQFVQREPANHDWYYCGCRGWD